MPKGMMRCEDALGRLWEYLDGELPSDQDEAVRSHLEICRRCYPEYDFQRAYLAYARRVREKGRAPEELRELVFELLAREDSGGATR